MTVCRSLYVACWRWFSNSECHLTVLTHYLLFIIVTGLTALYLLVFLYPFHQAQILFFFLQILHRKPPFIVVPPFRCVTPERITSGWDYFKTETHTEQLQIGQGNFPLKRWRASLSHFATVESFQQMFRYLALTLLCQIFFISLTVCQELCSSFEDPRADTVLDHLLACWNSNQQQRSFIGLACRRERVWSGTL